MFKINDVTNWRDLVYNVMAETGRNQVELARSIGVTQTAVCAWLKGLAIPNEEHRIKLIKMIR